MSVDALRPPRVLAVNALASPATSRTSLDDDDFDDDLDVPVPSIWQDKAPDDGATADTGRLPEEVRSGLIGFGLGLAVVVPIALFASGHFDGGGFTVPQGTQASSAGPEIIADASGAVPMTGSLVDGFSFPGREPASGSRQRATTSDRLPEPQTVIDSLVMTSERRSTRLTRPNSAPSPSNPDLVVMEARGLIANGDLAGARRLLEGARATSSNGEVLFLLAETYDPAVVANWGVADDQIDGDKARGIYMMALLAGVQRAVGRIKATSPQP